MNEMITNTENENTEYMNSLISRAENGDAEAMYELGDIYYCAKDGVEQDYEKSAKYYEQAALQGHLDAIKCISFMYQDGLGVQRDLKKSHMYSQQAYDIEEQQKIADLDNFQGSAEEIFEKGMKYLDDEEYCFAIKCFEIASKAGYVDAMIELGNLYMRKDYGKSRKYYTQALNLNSTEALYCMGLLCENETIDSDVEDFTEARKWYEKAADKNHNRALIQLGIYYRDGMSVPKNLSKAKELFKKGYSMGNAEGARQLGFIYEKTNRAKAKEWFVKAAESGDDVSKDYLDKYYSSASDAADNLPKSITLESIKEAIASFSMTKKELIMFFISCGAFLLMLISLIVVMAKNMGKSFDDIQNDIGIMIAVICGVVAVYPMLHTVKKDLNSTLKSQEIRFISLNLIVFSIVGIPALPLFFEAIYADKVTSTEIFMLVGALLYIVFISFVAALYYYFKHGFTAWQAFSYAFLKVICGLTIIVVLLVVIIISIFLAMFSVRPSQYDEDRAAGRDARGNGLAKIMGIEHLNDADIGKYLRK